MPKKYYVSIPNEELRKLCIEKGWCDNADNSQYEKIFYANENRHYFSLDMLSVMIWICSDGYEEWQVYDILLSAKTEYYRKYFGITDDNNNGYRMYNFDDCIVESENFENLVKYINDGLSWDFDLEKIKSITDCFNMPLWESN